MELLHSGQYQLAIGLAHTPRSVSTLVETYNLGGVNNLGTYASVTQWHVLQPNSRIKHVIHVAYLIQQISNFMYTQNLYKTGQLKLGILNYQDNVDYLHLQMIIFIPVWVLLSHDGVCTTSLDLNS